MLGFLRSSDDPFKHHIKYEGLKNRIRNLVKAYEEQCGKLPEHAREKVKRVLDLPIKDRYKPPATNDPFSLTNLAKLHAILITASLAQAGSELGRLADCYLPAFPEPVSVASAPEPEPGPLGGPLVPVPIGPIAPGLPLGPIPGIPGPVFGPWGPIPIPIF